MTGKRGGHHGRYSKTITPINRVASSANEATASSSKYLQSSNKNTTSSKKGSALSNKDSKSIENAATSSGQSSPTTGKDTSPSTRTPVVTGKAMTKTDKAKSSNNNYTTSRNNSSASASKVRKPASKATTTSTDNSVMHSTDFSHMRHRYYIVRPEPNKTCVPMIALDELPAGFRLKGIPGTVTAQQINEWDMARVGADVSLKGSFRVDHDGIPPSRVPPSTPEQQSSPKKENSLSPNEENTKESPEAVVATREVNRDDDGEKSSKADVSMKSDHSSNAEMSSAKAKVEGLASVLKMNQEVNEAVHGVVEKSKWEKENDRSKTQDAATPGVYGKKKYCTHWIRTGNCDYMQEGCRYLHVIPDAETRLTIGIRDMPRWAKEDLPSPPRASNPPRRRSWSPPKDKRDSQKDWRSRSNRKAHAELPAATAQGVAPASELPNINQKGRNNLHEQQQGDLSNGQNIVAPRPLSASTVPVNPASLQPGQHGPNPQASFHHHAQYAPLIAPSAPRAMQTPPPPSNLYSGYSSPDHHTHPFSPSYDEGNYNPFHSHVSPPPTPSSNRNFRQDSHRWGQPSHSPFGPNTQIYAQPRSGSPFGNLWRRGPFASPTPSYSEASVGTIGHGRPGASSPITPIMHPRRFVPKGEPQFAQAKPEPSAHSRNGAHPYKGKGTARYDAPQGDGGRSGELGNLISLDEEGNSGGK